MVQDFHQDSILIIITGAIQLKGLEQDEDLLKIWDRQAFVNRVQGMGNGVDNAFLVEILDEVIDILPNSLDVFVLRFADIECKDMEFAAVFREIGRDFFTYKSTLQMGYLHTALYGIVIRNGHEIHTPFLCYFIELFRFGITLRAPDFSENPFRGTLRIF
jgi:hypothetical protein